MPVCVCIYIYAYGYVLVRDCAASDFDYNVPGGIIKFFLYRI